MEYKYFTKNHIITHNNKFSHHILNHIKGEFILEYRNKKLSILLFSTENKNIKFINIKGIKTCIK